MDSAFLPLTKEDALARGWNDVDIVLVTGDAYVDHPSFGIAVIGRVLEARGYRVGLIAMPDWRTSDAMTVFGKPRLFFGVTAGNVDSMLSRYTAFKRYRSDDPYTPGGQAGLRPERAVILYCNLMKQVYKDVPIVIGGIEASLRRVAHYDFWSDRVRRSMLEDTRANILVYGMGEKQVVTIAERLAKNLSLAGIPGTVMISKQLPEGALLLPAEEDVLASKQCFAEFYKLFYRNRHRVLAQPVAKRYLIHYPPPETTSEELDTIYALPFTRQPHPSYKILIPAFKMIKDSVTSHRGCVSGCSFCSLTLHQGKRIVSRSTQSVLREVQVVAESPNFTGHITDIGGPSANNYGFDCRRKWRCSRESCTNPTLCPHLKFGTDRWIAVLEQASKIKSVSKVTVGSGIRYDLFMRDPDYKPLLKKLVESHISGQMKIAPEHTSPDVLRAMRKESLFNLKEFIQIYRDYNKQLGKRQHLIPYLMSCHPGCRMEDMINMKKEIMATFGFIPNQVQAFIPLPMTIASVIYYAGLDPLTEEHFFVERELNKRLKQHHLFFTREKR